jgi:tetratricopeptide (TPR) repeat protein
MPFTAFATAAEKLMDRVPEDANYPRSLTATVNLAMTLAIQRCGVAEELLVYVAQCAPDRIPMSLLEGVVGVEAERFQAIAALAEVSLVKHDSFDDGTQAITVHRLVQAIARARPEAGGMADASFERLIDRLSAAFPGTGYHDPTTWVACERLIPHVQYIHTAIHGRQVQGKAWAELLTKAGDYYLGRAATPQAEMLFREALQAHEKLFGSDHPSTLACLTDLASALLERGNFVEAQEHIERQLASRERLLGPEHKATAASLELLGESRAFQGDLGGAETLLTRALANYDNVLGREQKDTTSTRKKLADLRAEGTGGAPTQDGADKSQRERNSNLSEAKSRYQRVLVELRALYGVDH